MWKVKWWKFINLPLCWTHIRDWLKNVLMGLIINTALSCSHARKYTWNARIWKYLWYILSSFHFLYLEFIFVHPPSLFCQCCVGYLSSHLALEMTLVHQNLAIVNRTKHPKKGALEMILVHENLAIVNRTKHPNKVEKKVQEERTQVLAKSENLFILIISNLCI